MTLVSFVFCLICFVGLISVRLSCGSSSDNDNRYTYDYIVVGGGTGGSMVASELVSQLPNVKILLIEEGSFSRVNSEIDNLALQDNVISDPVIDKGYVTTPQTFLNNREVILSRAKVTGGCNSHNTQSYILADEMDFVRWGNIPGWSLNDVLDIFDEILHVNPGSQFDNKNPFLNRIIESCIDSGFEYNSNYLDLRNGMYSFIFFFCFIVCLFFFVICLFVCFEYRNTKWCFTSDYSRYICE